ncbi:hypothetical protein AVEN_89402-1 [Araneus ventricosus]|uniref:Uncharacterized protein n=1 Tax=Araneus ventricosus TaxID=182803 RepID=A0A4Y2W0M1_ARAVE|nr:hypothetical protein AVEN_89402-1 [Araneus ventricosus]
MLTPWSPGTYTPLSSSRYATDFRKVFRPRWPRSRLRGRRVPGNVFPRLWRIVQERRGRNIKFKQTLTPQFSEEPSGLRANNTQMGTSKPRDVLKNFEHRPESARKKDSDPCFETVLRNIRSKCPEELLFRRMPSTVLELC